MSTSRTFSPKLQKVFNQIQPALEGYQARLDRISNDIRNIENVLHAADFNLPVSLEVNNWSEMGEDVNVDDIESTFCGQELHYKEYLKWGNFDGKGLRLFYELYMQEGYIEVFEGVLNTRTSQGMYRLKDRKPLIDCKAAKRLELEAKLEVFLLEVGKVANPEVRKETKGSDRALGFIPTKEDIEDLKTIFDSSDSSEALNKPAGEAF